jgi:hypothetical protein
MRPLYCMKVWAVVEGSAGMLGKAVEVSREGGGSCVLCWRPRRRLQKRSPW